MQVHWINCAKCGAHEKNVLLRAYGEVLSVQQELEPYEWVAIPVLLHYIETSAVAHKTKVQQTARNGRRATMQCVILPKDDATRDY